MNLKYALVALFLTTACGPDWGDCKTCRPGEESAESVDGSEQIPVEVNVTVNVDVDQTQTQGQQQGQGQGQTQTQQPPASPPDAGTPPKPDAGPPPVCRKVCVKTETRYVCKQTNKDTSNKNDCRCGIKKTYTKCVKEETKCS